MKSQISKKVLILDFGYPMEIDAVKLIKKSLRNSLSLLATFYCDSFHFDFSIRVLNSKFNVTESTAYLLKNYNVISKKFDELEKVEKYLRMYLQPEISKKVTIQDYQQILKSSFEILLQECALRNQESSMNTKVQTSLFTKKRASLLGDILTDLINKILNDNESAKHLLERVNVIQIMESEKEKMKAPCTHKGNKLVNWVICGENAQSLDILMKDWFLRCEDRRQLKISLFKEINLTVLCDIEECLIRRPNLSILNDEESWMKSNRTSIFGTRDSVLYMEVLFRIPLSGLCPTVVFGAPCRVSPTRIDSQRPTEHQTNAQIFRALCRELSITEQGLLTKSRFENEVNIFHVLTSDGYTLLLNNVTPSELYLPPHSETFSKFNHFADQDANEIIKNSLRQVQFLEKYSPFEFRSGIYEYLESNIMRSAEKSSFLGNIDSMFKSQTDLRLSQKSRKGKHQVLRKNPKNEERDLKNIKEAKATKRLKLSLEKEYKNIHPALLPVDLIVQYGRKNPDEDEVLNIFTQN